MTAEECRNFSGLFINAIHFAICFISKLLSQSSSSCLDSDCAPCTIIWVHSRGTPTQAVVVLQYTWVACPRDNALCTIPAIYYINLSVQLVRYYLYPLDWSVVMLVDLPCLGIRV